MCRESWLGIAGRPEWQSTETRPDTRDDILDYDIPCGRTDRNRRCCVENARDHCPLHFLPSRSITIAVWYPAIGCRNRGMVMH